MNHGGHRGRGGASWWIGPCAVLCLCSCLLGIGLTLQVIWKVNAIGICSIDVFDVVDLLASTVLHLQSIFLAEISLGRLPRRKDAQ
jgi:hypothetical protein